MKALTAFEDPRIRWVAERIARHEYRRRYIDAGRQAHGGQCETEFVADWVHLYIPHAIDILQSLQ